MGVLQCPVWQMLVASMEFTACHRYPHVFTLQCAAHALDLALKQNGELDDFQSAVDRADRVVQFIVSQTPREIFKNVAGLRSWKRGKYHAGSGLFLHLTYWLASSVSSQADLVGWKMCR